MKIMRFSSEENLIIKLKQGDKKAFEQLYKKYREPLYAFALSDLKGKALAQDAVQEIFTKLWIQRELLNENLSIKSFLFTCLKHHVLNVIRSRKNEILKNIRIHHRSSSLSNETENMVILSDYKHWVKRGIDKLSDKRKEVVLMSMEKGLSQEEIADILGISKETVKTHLTRSNKFLRDYLKEHLQT